MTNPVRTVDLGLDHQDRPVFAEVRSRALRVITYEQDNPAEIREAIHIRFEHLTNAEYDPTGQGNEPDLRVWMLNREDWRLRGPAAAALWALMAEVVEGSSP